jgi:sec-independent protein translocase protein TatA
MGELSPWHWAIVALVFILLFGARRLPDAARGIGRSLRIFKAEVRAEDQGSESKPAEEPPAPPQVTAGPTTPSQGSAAPQQPSRQSPQSSDTTEAEAKRPSGH